MNADPNLSDNTVFFSVIIGIYFLNLLKSQQGNKSAIEKESRKELEKLHRLKEIKLSEPLSERQGRFQ